MNPLDILIWPEISFWDKIQSRFSDIASKSTEWFKSTFTRRLLKTSTEFKLSMEANDVGENLFIIAKDSGVALKEAGVKNLKILLLTLVFATFMF